MTGRFPAEAAIHSALGGNGCAVRSSDTFLVLVLYSLHCCATCIAWNYMFCLCCLCSNQIIKVLNEDNNCKHSQACAPYLDPIKFLTLPSLLQKEGWRTGHFGKWWCGLTQMQQIQIVQWFELSFCVFLWLVATSRAGTWVKSEATSPRRSRQHTVSMRQRPSIRTPINQNNLVARYSRAYNNSYFGHYY